MGRAEKVLELAKRRGFFWPSFEIYGGMAGFYDYGPLGTALRRNIAEVWRRKFVLEEGLLEIDTPDITPAVVFRASGHEEQFTDLMVTCTSCGAAWRVDELLEERGLPHEGLSAEEAERLLREAGIRCPSCGGELGGVRPFGLMFSLEVGAAGAKRAYLRPETAQGIFINFLNLYYQARSRIPFGAATIGKGYRNEISPRKGLIRLREFNMAEAEIFVDPETKDWPGFEALSGVPLRLVHGEAEEVLPVGEAVSRGIIGSRALGYFMAKTKLFLEEIGIPPEKIRFRKHRKEELAHYSSETWDAEIEISQGWLEVAGLSDRTDYDLRRHEEHSGERLRAFVQEGVSRVRRIRPKMGILGPMFKSEAQEVARALRGMEPPPFGPIRVEVGGRSLEVPPEAYEVVEEEVHGRSFIPHVIEPSFGLDRILYCLLENSYYEREGTGYRVLALRPNVAPVKAVFLPLVAKDGLDSLAREWWRRALAEGIESYYDDSGSIGRRYARADEIGVPFAVTFDYRTKEDGTVTVRDRDSTQQVRIPLEELIPTLKDAIAGRRKIF